MVGKINLSFLSADGKGKTIFCKDELFSFLSFQDALIVSQEKR